MFPGWHPERDALTGLAIDVKPFPPRPLCQVSLVCFYFAALLALVMALWQHTAAVAAGSVVESMGYDNISTQMGSAAIAMSWGGCGLLVVVGWWLNIMMMSMNVLQQLTAD